MTELFEKIVQWGYDRKIIQNSTPEAQFEKLMEEVLELHAAILSDDTGEIEDAIGDCVVVLTMIAEIKFEYGRNIYPAILDCVDKAYHEIKDRTGHLAPDGKFVKDDKPEEPDVEAILKQWADQWKLGDEPLKVRLRNGDDAWLTDISSSCLRGYMSNRERDYWRNSGKWSDNGESRPKDIVHVYPGQLGGDDE
jgi:NTP pyrophosphatase (non-canonical NTP hydrolase)